MPHSGGGGSHSGGGGGHSGSGGGSSVKVSSTPFTGSHTYVVYDKTGSSKLVYANSRNYHAEMTKGSLIGSTILYSLFFCKYYILRNYFVESDWSGASYWYEMVALSEDAEVVLPGLFKNSYQGDSKVADIFEELGVKTEFIGDSADGMNKDGVRLYKSGRVCDSLSYDFVDQPDLAQTFVVTCCMMGIPFHFTGLQSLKIKETDRIEALKAELLYVLEDRNDCELLWDGKQTTPVADIAIDTYEDHRMAMAFAPCALKLGHIKINNPQVVSKSYPGYWDDLKAVEFNF